VPDILLSVQQDKNHHDQYKGEQERQDESGQNGIGIGAVPGIIIQIRKPQGIIKQIGENQHYNSAGPIGRFRKLFDYFRNFRFYFHAFAFPGSGTESALSSIYIILTFLK
jgi:hypothetical protein